jgi:hypothetical protein
MIELRDAELPADAAAIMALDTGFSTDLVYTVDRSETGLLLRETMLAQPLTKRFPLDDLNDLDRSWTFAQIAVTDGRVCGFVAAGYQEWNRRLTLWHLYVHQTHRRRASLAVGGSAAQSACGGRALLSGSNQQTHVPAFVLLRRWGSSYLRRGHHPLSCGNSEARARQRSSSRGTSTERRRTADAPAVRVVQP